MKPFRIRDEGGRGNLSPAGFGYAGEQAGDADQYRGTLAPFGANAVEGHTDLALAMAPRA